MALNPGQLGAERRRQRPGQHGFAHARNILDQEMTARQGGDGRGVERIAGAQDDLAQIGDQRLTQCDGAIEGIAGEAGRWPSRRSPSRLGVG